MAIKIIAKLRAWFNRLVGGTDAMQYQASRLAHLERRCIRLESMVADQTDIAADINLRGPHHIVMVGRYRSRDYVQTFTLSDANFGQIVDMLRDLERVGRVRHVDAPPDLKGGILREQNRKGWHVVMHGLLQLPDGALLDRVRVEVDIDTFKLWFRRWVQGKIEAGEVGRV